MGSVKEIVGEQMRFMVDSDTSKNPYLCDIGANNGSAECGCRDWELRRWKMIKNGETGERVFCKHVRRARSYFLDKMIAEILKQQSANNGNLQPCVRYNSHNV